MDSSDEMPLDLDMPPFRPRFPWLNGDLQTLANSISRPSTELGERARERVVLPLRDASGDALHNTLDRPMTDRGGPLVILIHGAGGSEQSAYALRSTRYLLGLGYRVLRMNLRGVGPSSGSSSDIYYGGSSSDLRAAFASLDPALTEQGIFAVGYSLGGALLLKYLGEEGERAVLRGAATVSAPIDLSATSRALQRLRNCLYHRDVLSGMKEQAGAIRRLAEWRKAVMREVDSVWDYDDSFIAPAHDFAGAEDYYARCGAVRFMPSVRRPTLVISAADDSWIPIEIYRAIDWRANPALTPLLPDGGGHVGFHAAGDEVPWHDRAISRFIERIGA